MYDSVHFSYAYLQSACNLCWDTYLDFCPFFNLDCLFLYCWELRVLFIFCIQVLYQILVLQIFSLKLWLSFSFPWQYLLQRDYFNFNKVQLVNFFFHRQVLWYRIQKKPLIIAKPNVSRFSHLLSLRSSIVLCFMRYILRSVSTLH